MARVPGAQHEPTYTAAARFVERALATPASLFTPGRPVWTPEVLDDLHRRHATAQDEPGDAFTERWDRRLRGAPPETLQLAAEIAFVHLLFAADLTPESKRQLVGRTLARSPDPPVIPEELEAAFETGAAGSGAAFKLRRMSQLGLLIQAAVRWWQLPDASRALALADPWAFKAWLRDAPHDGAQAQREALLHLVHPDTFEAIVSLRVKQRIVHALSRHVPAGVDDLDRALAGIRAAM